MKFLLLTALTLATTGVHAQEYTTVIRGSEQVTDIDFEDVGAHVQCNGPNANRPCPPGLIPYTCGDGVEEMCCKWTIANQRSRKVLHELQKDFELGGRFGHCIRDTTDADAVDSSEDQTEEFDLDAATDLNAVDSSEDRIEELPGFLRGISLEGNNKCSCNKDKDCGNNKYCYPSNCSKHNGYNSGHCKNEDHKNTNNKCYCNKDKDCGNNEYCYSSNCSKHNGYTSGHCKNKNQDNKNKCYCNNNKDCGNNEYCYSSNCSKHNGYSGGHCKNKGKDTKNPNRACNYKQCQHKSNGNCECKSNERCEKGGNAKSYCNTSGEKNGCCVYDFLLDGQEVE